MGNYVLFAQNYTRSKIQFLTRSLHTKCYIKHEMSLYSHVLSCTLTKVTSDSLMENSMYPQTYMKLEC